MLGYFRRAWTAWRAKSDLLAPIWRIPPGLFHASRLQFPELEVVHKADGPELKPYEGLAPGWDEYASYQLPDYPGFLRFLGKRRKREVGSVLDLACGTGLLTARLVRSIGEVVGLDNSPHMLNIARVQLGSSTGASFVHGDFRSFALGRQFDAVVCASNSLNYVNNYGDLASIFACVDNHLAPDGMFVFDAFTERGMRVLSRRYVHAVTSKFRFAIHFEYDRDQRKETSRVITPAGVEVHRRIPIGISEVEAAVRGTGLRIEDYFGPGLPSLGLSEPYNCFFVLMKS